MLALLLLALLPTASAISAADSLSVSVSAIDSLYCPPRDTILARIHRQLAFDVFLERQCLWEALRTYARLAALREELTLLRRQETGLRQIHALNLEKQRRSEVPDLDVLQSEQNLLAKDMAIISQLHQIKDTIITLCASARLPLVLEE